MVFVGSVSGTASSSDKLVLVVFALVGRVVSLVSAIVVVVLLTMRRGFFRYEKEREVRFEKCEYRTR